MAIYQYHFTLIPRQSIIDKFGNIPTQLFIDLETRKTNKKKVNLENNFDEELIKHWWKAQKILFEKFESFIDSFAKEIEWTKKFSNCKSYGDEDSNDFAIFLDKEGYIEEFTGRVDLRKLDIFFITNLLALAKQMHCLILDTNGNLFEPFIDNLNEQIKLSSAFKFVEDPRGFLHAFSNRRIKPE